MTWRGSVAPGQSQRQARCASTRFPPHSKHAGPLFSHLPLCTMLNSDAVRRHRREPNCQQHRHTFRTFLELSSNRLSLDLVDGNQV